MGPEEQYEGLEVAAGGNEPPDGPCGNCGTVIDGEFFCFGCSSYICEACGVNLNMPFGRHSFDLHLVAGY